MKVLRLALSHDLRADIPVEGREERFWAWHDGMRDVCERLHVAFLPYDAELEAPDSGVRMAGDTAHYTLEGTRLHGLREGELMVRAWRQAQGATG